jgi:UDP-N-acetylglucosamine 1-carboxyvinyltransferase
VEGVPRLQALRHRAYPDRIEAGTLAIAVAMTKGDAVIEGYPREQLAALEHKLDQAGVEVTPAEGNSVRVRRRGPDLAPVDITTLPYPGFPTDLQAQWTAMMCLASGRSVITETIWENRFMHVAELNRMGADIQIESNHARVRGATPLSGAPVMASDLRASAALVLAGLVADGETVVRRIYHLDRGYERLEAKLTALGATLRREAE